MVTNEIRAIPQNPNFQNSSYLLLKSQPKPMFTQKIPIINEASTRLIILDSSFSFLGRMITSKIITRFSWFRYVIFCLLALILLILISQYLVSNINENLWMLLFLFPILGLFMSPLYPLFNSKFLINIDKDKVNILVSFIVIFSSLGSSFGSIGMSYVFGLGLDQYFILFALIPIVLILVTTLIFSQRLILRQ